jgi:hypothetical protein
MALKISKCQYKINQNTKPCIMYEEYTKKKKLKSITNFKIYTTEHIA